MTPIDQQPPTASSVPPVLVAAVAGRRDDVDRRYQRVRATIEQAIASEDPTSLTISGVARAAGVHRTYLHRRPELVELLHQAAAAQPSTNVDSAQVTAASLRADLAHARDRAHHAETETRRLRQRLSEALGQQVWADTGLGPLDEAAGLRAQVDALRQQTTDLTNELEDRTLELDAARAANRELMTQLNQQP